VEIKKLVDYPESKAILIHGNSGSGKTTLASTAPGPILFIDVEAGLTGLERTEQVDFAVVKNIGDIRKVYSELVAMKDMPYKTIVIDSLSQIGQWVIDEVKNGQEKQLTIGEWGSVVERIGGIVKAYRSFPLQGKAHLVVTSLTKEDQDEDRIYKRPDIIGKAANNVMAMVDATLYTFTVQDKNNKVIHRVLTRDTGKIAAKVRSNKIETVVEPNLSTIINILNQKELVAK
jgi:hypothetical protein